MNTDTPETDDNAAWANSCCFDDKFRMEVCESSFARKLERERNEARREAEYYRNQYCALVYSKDYIDEDKLPWEKPNTQSI